MRLRDPIMVFGATPRSGTNFLFNLLQLHPDCVPPWPIGEDYLFAGAELLSEAAALVTRSWPRKWVDPDDAAGTIRRRLGDGLLTALEDLTFCDLGVPGARIITKTPDCRGLDHVLDLVPDASLLLLIRDGRDAAESGRVAGFWGDTDEGARRWTTGARAIAACLDAHPAGPVRLVRYEDLIENAETELRRILASVRLDVDRYPFEQAAKPPVVGSSFDADENGALNFRPVEQTSDFDPRSRSKQWSDVELARFEWIAGDMLDRFGYPRRAPEPRTVDRVRQRALDGLANLKSRVEHT